MAGVGSSPLSVNQTKQYGDVSAIDRLKKATTTTPMTGNETPKQGQGGGGQAPAGAPAPTPGVPPEQQSMMSEMARAMKTAQVLSQKAAAPDAGPWLKYYASVAAQRYQALAVKVKAETPFFRQQG